MKEEMKLIVYLSQSPQRRISPEERDRVWMGAVEKDVLLILCGTYMPGISIAQATSREGIARPGYCFNL